MKYSKKQFEKDLVCSKLEHTTTLAHFGAFYNELGKMPQQKKQKYLGWRMDWIVPCGTILELGCHAGFNLIHYAKKGFNITGVDVSQSLIDEARRRIRRQPREVRARIKIIKGFIEKIEFDEKYDTILLTETLEHVINPAKVMKKASECLADGGSIFVTSPSTNTGNNSHVRGISLNYLAKLVDNFGMYIHDVEDIKGITAAEIKMYENRRNN